MDSITDELLEKLKIAVEAGEITSEDLDRLTVNSLTEELKDVVCLFHHILCERPHDTSSCTFYNEEQQARTWIRPAHKTWLNAVTLVLKRSEITEKQMLERIKEFHNIKNKLNWFAKFYFIYDARPDIVELVVDFKKAVNPMLVQNSNKEEEEEE